MSRLSSVTTLISGRSMLKAGALDQILGRVRLVAHQSERVVLLHKGKALGIYGPGEHVLSGRIGDYALEAEALDPYAPMVKSAAALALLREGRADQEIEEFVTGPEEVGLVWRDAVLQAVIPPGVRRAWWKAHGPFRFETLTPQEGEEISPALTAQIRRLPSSLHGCALIFPGLPGLALLLFVNGAYVRTYAEAGRRAFWSPRGETTAQQFDLRLRSLEVTGQEILTADRVSLRLSATAGYRIADPKLAATAVENYEQTLYLALQLAIRATVSARTLDQLLDERVAVDAAAAEKLRAEMAQIGLEVGAVEMKDVILPGEMREILNRVVAAEKEAEANVIRRREETAATRSLLNTAKLMTENPAMMRLKELEALETVASKVERLVVHSGPRGLVDLAKLDPEG